MWTAVDELPIEKNPFIYGEISIFFRPTAKSHEKVLWNRSSLPNSLQVSASL